MPLHNPADTSLIPGALDHDGSAVGFFGAAPVAKAAALTAANSGTVDNLYGAAEADVVNNLRTRLNQLEDVLQAYGLLP